MVYLLKEYFDLKNDNIDSYLTESERRNMKENNALYLVGTAQRANAKNGNRRIYPKDILAREVENYKVLIRERKATGCVDHEDSPEVSLQKASHHIDDIWWEGDDVKVKLRVLSGLPGQHLRSLVNDNIAIGLSSRGVGSTKQTHDGLIVEEDFQLICFDVVSEPSTQGAYLNLQECKKIDQNMFPKSYRIKRILNDIVGV